MTNIENCRILGHSLAIIGKDSTPMKRSLVCQQCGELAAYGVNTLSWGEWRQLKAEIKEAHDHTATTG